MANNHFYRIAISTCLIILVLFLFNNRYSNKLQKYFPSLNNYGEIDLLEFAPNHPFVSISAIEQLKSFPSAQFKEEHQLLPNFLWMDPAYLGGLLQPGYNMKTCVQLSSKIQAELAENWHYYYLVSNNLKVYKNYNDTNTFAGAWIKFANKNKHLPTAAISFWAQIQPFRAGGNCSAKSAYVSNKQQPDSHYVQNSKKEITSRNYTSPIAPIEALYCDFKTQSMYVDCLLSVLKRPLEMINENGEVFRLYEDDFIEQDVRIVNEKNKFQNLSWNEFQAMKRLEKEMAFRKSFMLKTELKNCLYTVYSVDGQNKYRHDYKTIRVINSKINDQIYSTPDFYPRYPYNWKDWEGPWHGLKWLEICRKTETDLGDNLFSPFVAAGWDSVEVNNIRPAQWLGLLKILGAMGAEYYYSGFFNTGKPVAKPENYIWQAVMPVYAQGISSFYEDILRNGKMIYNNQFIQYPENDVPVVIRKSNKFKTWVIACTWQTGTNFNKNIGYEKTVEIDLGHKSIKVKARRQGSVYLYSEENNGTTFYQIDGWHEYMHPYYWSKNINLEAELYTNKVSTQNVMADDYTNFTSSGVINTEIMIPFSLQGSSKKVKKIVCWVKNDAVPNVMSIKVDGINLGKLEVKKLNNYTRYALLINQDNLIKTGKHLLSLTALKPGLMLDKIEIENE